MSKSTKPKLQRSKTAIQRTPHLSSFAHQLLGEWRKLKLPLTGETVLVAVSGGADSVALLAAIDELIKAKKLKVNILVAHLNHQLRGKASADDAQWVERFSKQLGHRIIVCSVNVKRRVTRSGDNLEQAARRARYEFFAKTAGDNKAAVILTAHTMDDQTETVILNLLRGSGADGLGGIERVRKLDSNSDVRIARPLLSWAKRSDTENYSRLRGIDFRVDEMNFDESFARVRVRKHLLPLMRTFNPRVSEAISRTAEILREDSSALEAAASRLIDYSTDPRAAKKLGPLQADLLQIAQPALRRRALRLWLTANRGDLRRLEKTHIDAIENLLFSTKSGRLIELPGGGEVTRRNGCLHYAGNKSRSKRTRGREAT